MYSVIQHVLLRLEPEKAHHLALSALNYVPKFILPSVLIKPVQAMGLTFTHPIGLAAGLDKNADYLDALAKIGFSFIEVGTVTPKPQPGNPKPRLFRLPEARAVINRMGFNNKGVDVLVTNIQKSSYQGVLGINIGKNKDTPLDKAHLDYNYCLERVFEHASYITINISSPNTPDLRQLQQKEYFEQLLQGLSDTRKMLTDVHKKTVPFLIKISPDESEETLKSMVACCIQQGIDGIIATNTTCSRDTVDPNPIAQEAGGLSGRPLLDKSTQVLKLVKSYAGDALTLVGVGGVDSVESAQQKRDAGAHLIQLYTGLIYEGPGVVAKIVQGLD